MNSRNVQRSESQRPLHSLLLSVQNEMKPANKFSFFDEKSFVNKNEIHGEFNFEFKRN